MSGICIGFALGAMVAVVAPERITLAWDHTVEKIRWEEDYQRVAGGLLLVEARIRGQGAGMEVPEGAVRRAGAWHYRPDLPVLARLTLASAARYDLCRDGTCRPLARLLPDGAGEGSVEIRPCAADPRPAAPAPPIGLPSDRRPLE